MLALWAWRVAPFSPFAASRGTSGAISNARKGTKKAAVKAAKGEENETKAHGTKTKEEVTIGRNAERMRSKNLLCEDPKSG